MPPPKTKTTDNNYFEISLAKAEAASSSTFYHMATQAIIIIIMCIFLKVQVHTSVKSTNMNSFKFQMHKFISKGSGNSRARANTAHCVVPNNIHLKIWIDPHWELGRALAVWMVPLTVNIMTVWMMVIIEFHFWISLLKT